MGPRAPRRERLPDHGLARRRSLRRQPGGGGNDAGAIHQAGPRAQAPFIALNCGGLPRELLERLKELSRREGATLFMTVLALTAWRSAHTVSPSELFSTLQPEKMWPFVVSTAAPTLNFE